MHDFSLNIKDLSKVEGHVTLEVRVRNNKVESAKLIVGENKRFYEKAIRGKKFDNVPTMVSRICGTCSIAHLTCSIESLEKALDVNVSEQTMALRKLTMMGMILRDHAMHLYLFVLPDIFGKDSVLDFGKSQHKFIHDAFFVKSAGNELTTLVAGRAIHATYAKIGCFLNIPKRDNIKDVIEKLSSSREKVLDLLEILYNCPFSFRRKTNYLALEDKDFSFLEGNIIDAYGDVIEEKDFRKHLNEVVIPYSQGKGYEFEKKEYFVGALARLNVNRKSLSKNTKRDAKKYLKVFPSDDIYHNNIAQAIEMLHCIDKSIEILQSIDFRKEKSPEIYIKKESEGVGVIEAPRGILYYKLRIDKNGKISFGTFVTPTAQNQIRMENDIKSLVSEMLGEPKDKIRKEIEKLIRAYDPCMTCASNFLRIKWV